jgi:Zn-dependent protease with chaperone function
VALGLPLVTVLSPAERVALVAHELAHGRNGDSRRGLFVGSAVQGLVELYELLAPSGGESALDVLHAAVFWPLSRPILWLLHLESHLLLQDAQRAEYLADALAAEVAGTDAVVALSESLLLAPSFFTELDDMVGRVDSRERDRRRRIARLESSRLDATHPPTALRIELLEQRPRLSASVRLSPDSSAAIDAELGDNRPHLADALIDEQRDRIYY